MHAAPWLAVALVTLVVFAGCAEDKPGAKSEGPTNVPPPLPVYNGPIYGSNGLGQNLTLTDILGAVTNLSASLHVVGAQGAEPSIGVTSAGNIFFQAFEKTMRSTDHGKTFAQVSGPLTARSTSDPFLWVDQVTDRVFQVNMVSLACSHIAWSDDEGESWLGNPMDCGPVPVNDHIKLATGPWAGALSPAGNNPAYPNAVYYAYNKLVGGYMAVSLDGGASFPILREMFASGCNGALHGAITAAPDGTVYVPARFCPGPLVAYSKDNGLTWSNIVVGGDLGMPDQQKNPEVAVDTENNAYLAWVAGDNKLHMSVSRDGGPTWDEPVQVTPDAIGSLVWPTAIAGSPGHVGFAYIGTTMSTKGPWEVPDETLWHLYYTYTLNGLDETPNFVTVQLTPADDPIQRGTICVSSGACVDGNRNLLDFIDLQIGLDGRPYIAYADGCTSDGCRSPLGTPADSRDRAGMVAILETGPSLYAEQGMLASLE